MNTLIVRILEPAREYIHKLSASEKGTLAADIEAIRSNEAEAVHTKPLRTPVWELIFGYHRITYFKLGSFLYTVRGFRKKSGKTPKKEIDYATSIYKQLKNTFKSQRQNKRSSQ